MGGGPFRPFDFVNDLDVLVFLDLTGLLGTFKRAVWASSKMNSTRFGLCPVNSRQLRRRLCGISRGAGSRRNGKPVSGLIAGPEDDLVRPLEGVGPCEGSRT